MASVFLGFYKTRTSSTQNATTQERMEVADNIRRESRWTALLQRRNITAFMSPINSPHVSAKKSVKKEVKNDRFAQLMKWKEQKKKQMETMKANAKPIFKVCRVKEALRPDLSEIYGKIKGKETFKLACSSTHKFKPPSNVKPLNMKTEHTNANVKRRLNFRDDLEGEASKSSKLSMKINESTMERNTRNNSVIKVNNNSTKKKKLKSPKVKMLDVIEEKSPALGSISTRNSMKKIKNRKVETINVAEEIIPSPERGISINNSMKKLKSPKVKMVDVMEEKIPTRKSMKKIKNTKVATINVAEETISSPERGISINNSMKKLKSPKVKMVEEKIPAPRSINTRNSKKSKNTKVETINVAEETIPSPEWGISNNNLMKKLKSTKVKMVDVIEGKIPTRNSMKKIKNTKVETINVAEETIPSPERGISTNNSMKKLKSPNVKMGDVIEEKIPTLGSISTRNSTKKIKNAKVEMINVEEPILSSEESTNNSTQKLQSPKANVTPIQLKKIPGEAQMTSPVKDTVYISPFITISRGKANSRREYHERRSNIYESPTISGSQKNTTPKAAAAFFENLLRREEQRLNEVCSNWEAYEDSENPPEEACDMIRMAIGQTKLLLRKKFGKFRELISECRCPTSDKIVTCFDLHGFWDIITIQINNLDGRFENLDRLKISNWEEIVPVPLNKKERRPKRNNVKKKEIKSSLRDLIKEQRKRNVRKENKNSPMVVVTTPRGRLLNISNTMFPQSDTITPITLRRKNTPKSILKSEHSPKNRSTRKTKSVLFRDSEEKENVFESSDLIQFTPETSLRQYPRRSSRLAEKRINS